MHEEDNDPAQFALFQARLAALCYQPFGMIEALTVTPAPNNHQAVTSLRVIPDVGVEGQYPGKQWWRGRRVPGRQISAMSAEVLDALEIAYDIPGDNLIVRGLNLEELQPGDTLRIGDALLTVTATPHRPCAKFAQRTSPTKMKAISTGRLRGVLLDALHPAEIRLGDSVEPLIFSAEGV